MQKWVAHIRRSCVHSSGIGSEQTSFQRGSGSKNLGAWAVCACSREGTQYLLQSFFGLDLWWLLHHGENTSTFMRCGTATVGLYSLSLAEYSLTCSFRVRYFQL